MLSVYLYIGSIQSGERPSESSNYKDTRNSKKKNVSVTDRLTAVDDRDAVASSKIWLYTEIK